MNKRKLEFVDAYVKDIKRNQTAAAIAAGYSEKNAAQTASRLMKDDEVKKAIDERLAELHEQNTAKANEVIEFLTAVMRGEKVDNIPLFVGDGFQKLTEGVPSARDRLKAAEMLGKYYALFTDKTHQDVNHSGEIKTNNPMSGLTTEELKKLIDSG